MSADAIPLLAQAVRKREDHAKPPCEPTTGICAITGREGLCIPKKHLIKKSFANHDILAAPESGMVGVDAFTVMAWQPRKQFFPIRQSSWWCNGEEFLELNRQSVREIVVGHARERLRNPDWRPEGQWCAYATTSYKKYGALFAKVNAGERAVWRFENLDIDCGNSARVLEIWERLNEELRSGIWRGILETLQCPPGIIKKVGLRRWQEFEAWARAKVGSGLYQFMCYLLPSQDELKAEKSVGEK